MPDVFTAYCDLISSTLGAVKWDNARDLGEELAAIRKNGKQVFLCGNGGSGANALHWENDLIFGAGALGRGGVKARALPANPSLLTCLANDIGYDRAFSHQLAVLGNSGDLLIVFSGSGNSENIVQVLEVARVKGIRSWAVLGFDGGKALKMADRTIHFSVNDMQVAEDCQMVLGHIITRSLAGCH